MADPFGAVERPKECRRCHRLLAAHRYYRNGAGGLQSVCKDCHRTVARESARRRYEARSGQDKARKRERYATDARYRQSKKDQSAARWRRIAKWRQQEAA